MNQMPIYNSRILKNYLEYISKHYPEISTSKIIEYTGIFNYQVNDEGHWFTQQQVNRFHEIVQQLTENTNMSREVGRYAVSSDASGAIRHYLLGFVTPATAYTLIDKVAANLNRGKTFRTRTISPNHVEVEVTVQHDIQEQVYQCENRIGSLEALGKVFSEKFADIEHPICIHRGGDRCVYHVRWEPSAFFFWKRIRNYLTALSIPLCVTLLFFLPPAGMLFAFLLCLSTVLGLSFHTERLERLKLSKSIANQGDVAGRLLDQINLSYNNALLIQEIGQATSSILDIDHLLAFVTEALEKRLDFDRGMIMLANRERTRLLYTIGYGYKSGDNDFFKNIEFHLDKPDSRGVFVVSFKKQIPFLINDLKEIEKDISSRSLAFARKMGTQSFICAPIVFKGESLGVLVVDNPRSKRLLSQSDMSLLMGIAPQIAININNAISYRKVAESEKRFRSLSESAPDIIYTIDSEGRFTYVNPAWERILGHHIKGVLGRFFIDFVHQEEVPLYRKLFRLIRQEGKTVQDVMGTILHQDGSDRIFSISGAPNLDAEGQFIGVVGTFKDVTALHLSEAKLKQSYQRLQAALDSTIQALSMIVESRDPYTSGHQQRVAKLAGTIAEEMGLPEESRVAIRMAATLHDIGKISVPAEILCKPTQLNEIEMGMIQLHPETGRGILESIAFPFPVARIVFQHHERMDGSGYPMGLRGDEILLEAKIISVADVVEAMATHRPYRASLGREKALQEISDQRGGALRYDGSRHLSSPFQRKTVQL
jgi:PAS domain S-box-containing protein/putative nucleotidyltransferase with HDIG domain